MAMAAQVKIEPSEETDVEFLPLIYEIIRSIEKENHDAAQKAKDLSNTTLKMNELKNKLQQCRESIQRLPGIDYSKEDQVKRFEALRKQLIMKRELLIKYRNFCHFDVSKI
uniref:Mediator of RNA polymerase II transcription subunit 9 n=1 Tax=Strigamia maritima TaxID=126957 RepID=T1J6Y1_STRMM